MNLRHERSRIRQLFLFYGFPDVHHRHKHTGYRLNDVFIQEANAPTEDHVLDAKSCSDGMCRHDGSYFLSSRAPVMSGTRK